MQGVCDENPFAALGSLSDMEDHDLVARSGGSSLVGRGRLRRRRSVGDVAEAGGTVEQLKEFQLVLQRRLPCQSGIEGGPGSLGGSKGESLDAVKVAEDVLKLSEPRRKGRGSRRAIQVQGQAQAPYSLRSHVKSL